MAYPQGAPVSPQGQAQGYPPPGYQQYGASGTGPVPPGHLPVAPPGMYFDPVSRLFLPDGTQLASAGRRIGAGLLSIILPIVTLVIGYVLWGAIIWARGQTPTLQVLGMRCWRPETGRVAGWGWMALRETIGRLADGVLFIITLLISFIMMVSGTQRKTLHDMVAGTVVLRDPNKVLSR
jgi:uncharacterized RDD family membrane protein YckC